MRYQILGSLEVNEANKELTPTTPKLRQVLALLLVRHNRIVHTSEFVDELWGEDPPPSALATLQTYVYKLRKLLAEGRPDGSEERLRTKPHGYVIDISGDELDLSRFGCLVEQGRQRLDVDDHEQGSRMLSEALAMWRGPVLADVVRGDILRTEVTRLEEWRLQALEARIDADLTIGRHRDVISELRALTAAHPLHEGFQGKLMLALHRSGRRYEALDVYHRLCQLLDRELGLEPSLELVRLHHSLLSAPPAAADGSRGPVTLTDPGARPLLPPAQLPPAIADLTGRADLVARIERRALTAASDPGQGYLASLTGGPGTGKTALAVHIAHRLSVHFPDGQLFVDLGATRGRPSDPAEVLDQMLRALGVPAEQVPATLDERSTLLRTVSANRRLLIVLDDADSLAQVSALLPGSAGPAVLVTGRSLAVPAADSVVLDPLDVAGGIELLSRIIGADRTAAEPAAAERIVRLCGGLPLALWAVGTRLAVTWVWPLDQVAEHLATSSTRLSLLRFADLDVRASYDASFARLDESEQAAFVLLGLMPLREFTATEAAGVLGCGRAAADAVLARLVDAHLLRAVGRGMASVRYAFDELTYLYAKERVDAVMGQASLASGGGSDSGPDGIGPRDLTNRGLVLLESGVAGLFRAHHLPSSQGKSTVTSDFVEEGACPT
jgi:DNA-binding SARP family transcriptional activator